MVREDDSLRAKKVLPPSQIEGNFSNQFKHKKFNGFLCQTKLEKKGTQTTK